MYAHARGVGMTERQQAVVECYAAHGGAGAHGSMAATAREFGIRHSSVQKILRRALGPQCEKQERQAPTSPEGHLTITEALHIAMHERVYEMLTNPPGSGLGRRIA